MFSIKESLKGYLEEQENHLSSSLINSLKKYQAIDSGVIYTGIAKRIFEEISEVSPEKKIFKKP